MSTAIRRHTEGHAHNDIRRLAPDARELLQCLEICRNLTAIFLQQDIAGLKDMLCLHAEEPTVMDRRLKFRLSERGNCLRRICTGKETARHNVYPHIRALCRENYGNEQFKRRLEFKCRSRVGIKFAENAKLLRFDGFRYSHISSSVTSSAREFVRRAQ